MKVWTYDSFTNIVGGGNPAGVVDLTDGVYNQNDINEADMLEIAKKVGFSETAFIMNSDKADYKVRFFTPADEVDLCGHATIAVFSHLFGTGKIGEGAYTQETKAGILGISIDYCGEIYMEQVCPVFSEIIAKEEIADSLGIFVHEFLEKLPIEVVSTGLRDIIIPVNSLEILRKIKPDFEKVKEISKKYKTTGYHIFTTETENKKVTAECRNLAPLYDIPEEAATGTASGALTGYLYKYNEFLEPEKKLKPGEVIIYNQGYTMGRPSEIKAIVEVDECEKSGFEKNPEISRIKIGGRAVLSGII